MTSPTGKAGRCNMKVKRERVATFAARFSLAIGVCVVQDRKSPGQRPYLTKLQTGMGDTRSRCDGDNLSPASAQCSSFRTCFKQVHLRSEIEEEELEPMPNMSQAIIACS